MNTKEHWLKGVLLNFQSGDEEKNQEAWIYIGKITGKNASSFTSHADALAHLYAGLSSDGERDEYLRELSELVRHSKKYKFSLTTMGTIILLVALIEKTEMFADAFARNFVFAWRNAGERLFLAAQFLSVCDGCEESIEIYKAVLYLVDRKWIPRKYAMDACSVLLSAHPRAWLRIFTRMAPVVSRYKNKLIRDGSEYGMKEWESLEKLFLAEIKIHLEKV
ncbi:MAG: hypothetical protein M0P64_03805 [Candidatus Pacebacteria bacterium]|jgi:hypothetical protein|nr:hypothetical protein [Candidatus Paceibacterota bacterium]